MQYALLQKPHIHTERITSGNKLPVPDGGGGERVHRCAEHPPPQARRPPPPRRRRAAQQQARRQGRRRAPRERADQHARRPRQGVGGAARPARRAGQALGEGHPRHVLRHRGRHRHLPAPRGRRRPTTSVLHRLRPCHGRSRRRAAIVVEIERIKKEVEEVSRRRERYRIDDHVVAVVDDAPVDRRLPALYANFASLVGVDASVEEVIKLLSMEGDQGAVMMRRKLKLIAIVGPGGIGKTTLANLVYQKLHGQFECQAFVSVSQKPNVKAVLSSILCQVSQLKYENFSSWGEKEIIDKIRDVLKDIRYVNHH